MAHKSSAGGPHIRRVYEAPEPSDGARVLVDRLWPRGLAKEDARLTEWCKAVAPSTDLRRWYGHDPERFAEFADRYREELARDAVAGEALHHLRALADDGPLTLLTATKDLPHGHVQILLEELRATG
ncbi:DUF488 family protein [Streptomyces sp. NBC_01525]|uniref:DUF488 family protein n=1 Tax=Streptomyces benahoarensis TaxID=2595054 RepID=A0A553YWX7_9ACTN|nr:DUF488 family protein [Streptomyces benahoarensis]TSB17830.1 DUF488 family protein [Streptomyces benahoarensis]TSB33699.1 DUF488 family protein [Streptomyces benahoarensis]